MYRIIFSDLLCIAFEKFGNYCTRYEIDVFAITKLLDDSPLKSLVKRLWKLQLSRSCSCSLMKETWRSYVKVCIKFLDVKLETIIISIKMIYTMGQISTLGTGFCFSHHYFLYK